MKPLFILVAVVVLW